MRSFRIRVGSKFNGRCPYKKRREHRDRRGTCEDEAEIGVTQPQARNHEGHQELKEARMCSSLEASDGTQPC